MTSDADNYFVEEKNHPTKKKIFPAREETRHIDGRREESFVKHKKGYRLEIFQQNDHMYDKDFWTIMRTNITNN
jgi:hypothetical protein